MKLRRRKIGYKLLFVIMFIIFFSVMNVFFIGKMITSKVTYIYNDIIEKNIYNVINELFSGQMVEYELSDFLKVNKNSDGELIYVNYNYDVVSKYLKDKLNDLYNKIDNVGLESQYYDKRNGMLMVPLGIITDNLLFSNIGPKIPCKLNIINNIDICIKTRIKDYGINNSLLEVFVLLTTKSSIVNPVISDKYNKQFEIMIASKVIEGKIPSYYGGYFEKSSPILSS